MRKSVSIIVINVLCEWKFLVDVKLTFVTYKNLTLLFFEIIRRCINFHIYEKTRSLKKEEQRSFRHFNRTLQFFLFNGSQIIVGIGVLRRKCFELGITNKSIRTRASLRYDYRVHGVSRKLFLVPASQYDCLVGFYFFFYFFFFLSLFVVFAATRLAAISIFLARSQAAIIII